MAIEAFGLATTSTGAATSSIKIESGGSTPADVYMRWHTMQGAGVIKAFDLAVSVRRVYRSRGASTTSAGGGVSDTQYGDWSDWYYEQVPIAQCMPVNDSTGYNYAHTLNLGGMYAKEGLANAFSFNARTNDEVHFQLKVKAVYETTWANAWNEGVTVSPVSYAEAWIGWIPKYTVSAASFDLTGDITLTFNRPYWQRTDDEWVLTSLNNSGANILAKKISGKVGNGTIKIPRSALTRNVAAGVASRFAFTINAAYKSKGYTLTTCTGSKQIADLSNSSTPIVTVKTDIGAMVTVSAENITPKSTKFDIKLRGYGDDADMFTDVNAGTHYIAYPPLDTPFYIDVRGRGTNSQSIVVSKGPFTISSDKIGALIQDVDNSMLGAKIYYGRVSKRSGSRDINIIKLAGRERSTAYFGTGATVSETMQGKIIDQQGIEKGRADALEELVTKGKVVMVRKPGGYRHRCVISKFTAQRGCVSPVVDVQISLTEVD